MRHRIPLVFAATLALALGAASAFAADGPAPGPIAIGTLTPSTDVKMKNVDGKELSIADVQGEKGTLVIFSCNECPFSKAWEERIVALGNTYSKRGVGVIMVNSNDPNVVPGDGFDAMVARAGSRAMAFPYVVDATSDVARSFGATRTPEAFLFDKNGKLVYHGAVDDSRDAKAVKTRYLETALTAVAAGKKVKTAKTKSVGCTIKWREKAAS